MKRHFVYSTVVFILVALAFGPRPAHAGNAVVGNGTPASCTEAALQAALGAATAGGGTVTFDCGQSAATPVTILLSQRLALPNGVIIDGGDERPSFSAPATIPTPALPTASASLRSPPARLLKCATLNYLRPATAPSSTTAS